MKKRYIKSIIFLLILTIISFIGYIIAYSKCEILSNVFCNISIGFITGFVILIITNQKKTLIYKNKTKANKIKEIIDTSREYEIKVINYGNLNKIPIIKLINIYADLCNLLTSINELDNKYFNVYNYDLNLIIKEYDSNLEDLSEITYLVYIDKEEFQKKYSKDLSKKMVIIYKLRKLLINDLKDIEKEIEALTTSIF